MRGRFKMFDSVFHTDVKFKIEVCCHKGCGVHFGLPYDLYEDLVKSHNWFYCPNGHNQHYVGKTEEEKLREELSRMTEREADQRRLKEQAREETQRINRTLITTKGHITRVKNRIVNGVCPCCNRTFQNLKNHMKTQHPAYKKIET